MTYLLQDNTSKNRKQFAKVFDGMVQFSYDFIRDENIV